MNARQTLCSHCGAVVALEDVNVAQDIALCRSCGKTMPFSDIAPLAGAEQVDFRNPPKGVRLDHSTIRGKTVIYRKIHPMVFFLIPFTLAWSGFSLVGIYGSQIREGEFDVGASLFGLPFLIGSIVLVSAIVFLLFGRWRFSLRNGMLEVAAEVGPVGWRRRMACDKSARVSIRRASWTKNNQPQHHIQVDCMGNTLKFASILPDAPKHFIAEAIRRMIAAG